MARMPVPVKSPKAKSAVSSKTAMAKATAATAKAERGVAQPRMPKMSTAKGSSEALARGAASRAGKARNAVGGGFGASVKPKYPTPTDRAGSKANIVRAAEKNRAGQRASAVVAGKAAAKATATRKAAGAVKGAKIGAAMDKRAGSFKGADVRAANNTIRRAKQSAYPKGKTLPVTK